MTTNYWIGSASGDWNDPSHWSHGEAPLATDDVGIIQTGTFTVSVTGAVAVNSILFDSPGATFAETAGGSIATAGNFEIDSGLASLSGVNSFGQILLTGGTLQYCKGTALSGGQLELTGGVLRSTGSATVSNFLDIAGDFNGQVTIDAKTGTTLAIGGGGFSIAASGQDIVFNAPSGATANTGTIVWSGGGNAGLTGSDPFTVTVAGGTLRAGDDSIETLLASNVHVDSEATIDLHGILGVEITQLTLDAGGTIQNTAATRAGLTLQNGATVNGTITGNIAVGVNLGGVVNFDSSQHYTGGTTISGELSIGGADQVSVSGPIVVDNGVFIYASDWTGSATYGAISGNGVVEVKSGTLLFNHANSFSGGTYLLGGTLALGNANGLGTVNGTGGGGVTFGDAAGDTRPVLLGTTTETVAGALALEYNSEIAATTGTTLTLTKGGILVSSNFPGNQVSNIQFNDASHAGTVVFEASAGLELNSGTAIDVTLAAGTLKAGDDALSELANAAAQFTIDAGTTLDLNGHDLTVSDNFSLPSAPFSLVNSSSTTANLTIEHQYDVFSVPTGNLNVSLVDADMVAVNTAYTGSTSIDADSLVSLAPVGSDPVAAFSDLSAIVLDRNSGSFANLAKAQTVTLNGSIDDEGILAALVTQKVTLMSNFSGAGVLDLFGGGSTTFAELGGNNSGFTGAVVASDVVVMVDQASGLGAGTFTAYDAGVIVQQSLQLATSLSFHGDASISAATGAVATLSGSLDFSTAVFALSGNNYGHLSVSFGDTAHKGTIVLASSAFEEDTSASQPFFVNVNGGTLKAGNSDTLQSLATHAATFAIASGATVDLNGFALSLGAFNSQGTITNTASTLATLTTTAWSTVGGIVTGDLALDVSQGLLMLTGNATYTGGTTVAIGATLQIGNGGSTGTLSHAVVDNGGLVFDHNAAQTFAGAISGSGTVAQLNIGPLKLSGVNSYSGGTFIDNGAILVTNAASLGTGVVAISNSALIGAATTALSALTAAANTTTLTGFVEIAAAHGTTFSVRPSHLTLNGGRLLFGDSTHDGTVNFGATHFTESGTLLFEIADGQVNATGNANVFSTGTMKIDAGATLNVNGLAASLSSLTGAGTLTNTLSGTAAVSLSGATSFDGTVAGAIALAINGTAVLSGNETFTGTATLGNHATLTIGGTWNEKLIFASGGRVNLTSPNSFSGTIGGFQEGDTVNLDNIAGASATHSWNAATNTLTVTGGGHTDTLKFTAGLTAGNFKIVGDGAGGTNVIYQSSPQAPVPDVLVFSSMNTAAQSSHSDTAIHDIVDRSGPVPPTDVSYTFDAAMHDELLVTMHHVTGHGDLWA